MGGDFKTLYPEKMRIVLLFMLLAACGGLGAQKPSEIVSLLRNWYFSPAGAEEWLEAEVPGTVHQDLLRHQILPDPFYGTHEEKIQWVEEKDWEYKTVFTVTSAQLERDAAVLNFEGLDTYADVYLNGALILKADNMFVGYRVPVKPLLRCGENHLRVYFHSPVKQTLPQWQSNGFNYPADNDHRAERLSVFTRKAPYSYGWDWGIRMVTSGIWRPVTLCFQDVVRIEDLHIRQLELSENKARLSVELELERLAEGMLSPLKAVVTYFLPGQEPGRIFRDVELDEEHVTISIPCEIEQPQRWMPNGWGKPVLYQFEVKVYSGEEVVAAGQQRVGLRTVKVGKEKDKWGESFYFEVNGVPLFAKGANYIPGDALLPAMSAERYRTLFRDIRDAHMNMIRVWGGGSYEDNLFYDLADENGILVWQDFMFACTTYPSDPVFLKRVEAEAEYNIRRLRNHACLAMWCGNNEIQEGIRYWGWKSKYTPAVYEGMCEGYDLLFKELLPGKVKELDGDRFYMPTSPDTANWGRPESWKFADSHNWGVWYGRKPFESLDEEIPRFMSEFGFQSFPEMKTISAFASQEDYGLESRVMNAHQKSTIGNELIRTYMERDYVVPEKFEDFVYVGLVMQGRGIRRGLEAHRRNRPYCMGTLYWQLNDSWPVVSWSGNDYYGNWKALHNQAKRAFAPLAVSVLQAEDSLQFWLLSDLPEAHKGLVLEAELTDFYGRVLGRKVFKADVAANTSVLAGGWDMNGIEVFDGRKMYLSMTLKDESGKKWVEEPYFFVRPKELDLPEIVVNYKMKVMDGVCEVVLKSAGLAKDVFIEVPVQGARFSDNFFDLLPATPRKVVITSPVFKKGGQAEIKINHLRNTYK